MAITKDVVVWGSHWASINAALAAKEAGASVILVSNWTRLGDPMINGLGRTDFGRYGQHGIGTWFNYELFNRLSAYIGTDYVQRVAPPTMFERTWKAMLDDYGVEVRLGSGIASSVKVGDLAVSITLDDGTVINGSRFIDGDEDGQLMKQFLPYTWGRESAAAYGESLAGFFPVPATFRPMNIRNPDGSLIRGISPYPALVKGDADLAVPAYGYRLPTTVSGPMLKWTQPAGYDPALIEFLKRSNPITSDSFRPIQARGGFTAQSKIDNNSIVNVPAQWGFPDGSQAQQDAIQLESYNTQATWLYECATSPDFSLGCRQFMATIGLCLDEMDFTGTTRPGWPKQMYRRTGLRMLTPHYMMTQADAQTTVTKTDSMGMGFYSLDNKPNQFLAYEVGGVEGYIQDAFGSDPAEARNRQVVPYELPRRAGLSPDCRNVASPNCAGTTYVLAQSWRIDIWKAGYGAAMGALAALSLDAGVDMIDYDYPTLEAYLLGKGQVLHYTPP